MTTSTNKPSHLRALLIKNWILWKRSWKVSLLEIVLPIIFVFLTIAFRKSSPADFVGEASYFNSTVLNYDYNGLAEGTDLALIKYCNASKNGGKIALAPTGDNIVNQLDSTFRSLYYDTIIFDSMDAMDSYTTSNDYTQNGKNLCFGIVMSKNNIDNTYEYYLRFNLSQQFGNKDIPDLDSPRIKPMSIEFTDSLVEYGQSGFLFAQNMIDNLIIRNQTNTPSAQINSRITSRTIQAHIEDDLAASLSGQFQIFFALPILLPYLRFLNGIVSEKEKRIREGMKIMGLKNSAFYLSWFINYFIVFTLISLIVAGILYGGFFTYSSYIYIFLWHWEFSLCLMALGFLVSVFFSKAKQANVTGFIICFLFSFVQTFANKGTLASGKYLLMSLAPQTSLGLAATNMMTLEAVGLGLTKDTYNVDVANYRMTFHYWITFFDIVLFLVLGAYLDQVLPSEFGIRKHPLFCLMRSKKSRSSRYNKDGDSERLTPNADFFEGVDPSLKAQDSLNESVMVQDLHKKFDSGKVAVDGVSFNLYKSQIFALLGHNGAGKTTTISMITGLFDSSEGTTKVFGLDIQNDLDEVRKTMGVCPQHDILFDDLTVKEHLELYSVFKGVDSASIPAEVEKIIVDIGLADKRDYLSKNLSGGQKRKLSIGIAFIGGSKFIILDEPSSGMDTSARRKLWELLKNYKNDRVVLLTTHFMDEADYLGDRIGIMGEGKLKCLGRPLFLKTKFGVGYSLTLVKKDINHPSEPIKVLVKKHVPESKVLSDVSAEVALQLPLEAVPKFKDLFIDLDAKLEELKVSTYGVSVTTLEEVFLNVAKITTPEKHYSKEIFPEDNTKDDLEEFDLKKDKIPSQWGLFKSHFHALSVKRYHYFKRDKKGLCCEILLPVIMIIVGILITKASTIKNYNPMPIADNLYDYKVNVGYNTIIPADGSTINPTLLTNFNTNDLNLVADTTALNIAQFNTDVYNMQGKDIIRSPVNVFSFYAEELNTATQQYEYTAFIDTRAQEGAPFAMNKINNAILKTATGNSAKSINVIIYPFLRTKDAGLIENLLDGISYSFIFSVGMSFIPASLITFIVKERTQNVKHQQLVSGVSLTGYWFSNYFVDILKYLIPGIINSLIAMAFHPAALVEGDKLGGLWCIFILYGFAVTSFVYLTSFLFKDYGSAQVASFFFHFVSGFVGGLTISVLRLIDSTEKVGKILQWVLRPLPTFAMTNGFLNLSNRELYALKDGKKVPDDVYSLTLVGGDILFLILQAVGYLALVFIIERLRNSRSLASIVSKENKVPYVPKKLDDDVEREMLEVEKSDNKTYSIKVDKLRKVYDLGGNKHKVAVDCLSFGVKNGECFALLGVNGAGKTTTFKILSGDYMQTTGKAYIASHAVPEELQEARNYIGYCPQFDALLENLTAKEHLFLYAAIKGIPHILRERFVEKQLREMNLKQYENVCAGTYSGGNKRKLSVAIAMIGNPPVVFLDEPSTGMDPEARRFMWNVISKISRERKLSSVILTTHSMEEAEALATKMGIMVDGNLQCLGTSQHIKNKFGGGYEIEIKLDIPTDKRIAETLKTLKCSAETFLDKQKIEAALDTLQLQDLKLEIDPHGSGSAVYNKLTKGQVPANMLVEWILMETDGIKLKAFLKKNFGDMTVIEHFQSFFRFKTESKIVIGKFFGSLEENKQELNVLQYSIRQTTIEQIFNNFAVAKPQLNLNAEKEQSQHTEVKVI